MKNISLPTALLLVVLMLSACSSPNNEAVSEPPAGSTEEAAASGTAEGDTELMEYDFKQFSNVNITGIDLSSLTEEELFADVADRSLNYFTIGIADPVIKVDGDKAQITYTSVLNANAYGARGTYRMKGTHYYELRDGSWIAVGK